MLGGEVKGKFLGMRKEQEFTVYPFSESDQFIIVQSDRAIGKFDKTTRYGVLNYKGSGSKHFVHLLRSNGSVPFTFPIEFVEECRKFSNESLYKSRNRQIIQPISHVSM